MTRALLGLLILFTASIVGSPVWADNWPPWRGPDGDGVSQETDLPVTWSDESGVEWKCQLPAWGDSTPVIWTDAVFVTSQLEDGQLVLLRIDKNRGHVRWTRKVGVGVPRIPASGRKDPAMRRFQEFHREQAIASPAISEGRILIRGRTWLQCLKAM